MRFYIDRREWLRGTGSGYLLRAETPRRQCCVGIYLTALGVPDEELRGIGCAAEVTYKRTPAEAMWLWQRAPIRGSESEDGPDYEQTERSDTLLASELYQVNDNTELTAEDREQRITELFRRAGIEVVFVG